MPKQKVEKDTSERWLLTYSDLMNLLLILFIILYCSSQLDAKKSAAMSESLQEGFSTMQGTAVASAAAAAAAAAGGDIQTSTGDAAGVDAYWDDYAEFFKEINDLLKQGNLQNQVDTTLDDTGIIISFKDNALFPAGSATLSEYSSTIINEIGTLLVKLDYSFILVEGHTDSDPISTARFVDNMDLSSARAGSVWRALVNCGLTPESMASIGYGEYRPVAENDTAENKAKNRRVVISILKKPFTASTDLVADDMAANPTPGASSSSEASASPEATSSGQSESTSPEASANTKASASPDSNSGTKENTKAEGD